MPTSVVKREASWQIKFEGRSEVVRVEIGNEGQIFIEQGTDIIALWPGDIDVLVETLATAKAQAT